ncbi:MAG: GNAT family N-acetyltransferase [Phycisphaerales bacterium]|nr:GNAT family N-acetyltransferase [Phycisphaerales bacterium]
MNRPAPWTPPDPLPTHMVTPRLDVRPMVADDAVALFDAIEPHRASYLPWLEWVRVDDRSVAECVYQIEAARRDAASWPCHEYRFGIFSRADDGLLGAIGFRPKAPALHVAEIGYWVRPEARSRGVATEATGHLISWLFTPQEAGGWGLRRVDILMAAGNESSQAVPRRLNLRLELAAMEERYVEGPGFHDTRGYGVLASEWDLERHAARPDRRRGLFEAD